MFQPRFASLVEAGTKTQTVRKTPNRMPKVGDRISLRCWTDKPYRSPQRVLRDTTITRVAKVWIGWNGILVDGRHVESDNAFARADGFADFVQMHKWFCDNHGIPIEGWTGILICWQNAIGEPAAGSPTH